MRPPADRACGVRSAITLSAFWPLDVPRHGGGSAAAACLRVHLSQDGAPPHAAISAISAPRRRKTPAAAHANKG